MRGERLLCGLPAGRSPGRRLAHPARDVEILAQARGCGFALHDGARIVKENNLTLTTMIVVGEAIGNREGLSRLYAHEFKHLYRK